VCDEERGVAGLRVGADQATGAPRSAALDQPASDHEQAGAALDVLERRCEGRQAVDLARRGREPRPGRVVDDALGRQGGDPLGRPAAKGALQDGQLVDVAVGAGLLLDPDPGGRGERAG
jgi:hypothetical protein